MTVRTLPLLLLALLVPATTAGAATTVDGSGNTVFVEGDAGANAVTISHQDEFLVVSETGKKVIDTNENDGCEQDGDRVRCTTLGTLTLVRVRGGEGDDVLTDDFLSETIKVSLQGLAGNDTLNSGGQGPSTEMLGGDGDDKLNARAGALGSDDQGGAGNDTFTGNAAADDSFKQEPGADTYIGGHRTFMALHCLESCPDGDALDYETGPVTVTLDGLANDGAAGEGDNVRDDVDAVSGTDAADTLSAAGAAGGHSLSAGPGDDALTGGAGGDVLDGGTGADILSGMGGDDRLLSGGDERTAPSPDRLDGGDGDDVFDAGYGAEELIGGAGIDRASFVRFDAFTPVAFEITLDDQPNDGPRGGTEHDNVHADVESIATGPGADRIVGSAGADQLSGGAGDDEIEGRGGFDILEGDAGADTLLARDGGFDVVNCGEGADPTAQGDGGDRLEGCEASSLTPPPAPPDTVRPQLMLGGATTMAARSFGKARGVTVTARTNESAALLGQVTVRGMLARVGDYVLGQRSLPAAGTTTRRLRIRFGRRDSRAIMRKLRRRAYRLTVRVTATDAAGNRTTVARRITIRRR